MANFTLTQNSTNVNNAINNVHNAQTTPTNGSATMVTSGGVYTAINNLTTANLTAATLVTQAEGIASNDNETTLPTSAAVKDFVDTTVAASANAFLHYTGTNLTVTADTFVTLTEVVDTKSIGSLSTITATNDAITLPAGYYMLSMEFNATEPDSNASNGYKTHIQTNVNGAGESSLFHLDVDENITSHNRSNFYHGVTFLNGAAGNSVVRIKFDEVGNIAAGTLTNFKLFITKLA